MALDMRLDRTIEALKSKGRPFVLATVVRTVSVTAAKAGAKAVILDDGTIADGWIGGGCARGAVLQASRQALADGQAKLVSVQPEDLLSDLGVTPGSEKDGIRFARNMCPSKGTMDVFIEPILPLPELCILGASPVAIALAGHGASFGFRTILCAPRDDQPETLDHAESLDGIILPPDSDARRFVVVATQGRGDEKALRAALAGNAERISFVGSHRKAEALRGHLGEDGVGDNELMRIKAPAGLDLGAITPEEIALSILAELIQWRRQGQRDDRR